MSCCGHILLGALGLWFLVLSCWTTTGSSHSCACNDTCEEHDCEFTVWDTCGCCQVCAQLEGEWCGSLEGECAPGLECVKDLPPNVHGPAVSQFPGTCMRIATTSPPTAHQPTIPTTTITTIPATAGTISLETIAECARLGFVPKETNSSSDGTGEAACLEKCSIDACSGSGRARVCSAKGLEFSRVSSRGACQHTSCRACFLYVESPCGAITCSEPPTKKCLRPYYQCIREHVLRLSPRVLTLEDPAARNHVGRIICHVAEKTNSDST